MLTLNLHNLKSLPTLSFYTTLALIFTTFANLDFTVLQLQKQSLKSLLTISLPTTLAHIDFSYIPRTWFQISTISQPQIFIFVV